VSKNLETAVQYLRRGRDLPPEVILDALSATFPNVPRLSPHALASNSVVGVFVSIQTQVRRRVSPAPVIHRFSVEYPQRTRTRQNPPVVRATERVSGRARQSASNLINVQKRMELLVWSLFSSSPPWTFLVHHL
jgi:hypothetical protein